MYQGNVYYNFRTCTTWVQNVKKINLEKNKKNKQAFSQAISVTGWCTPGIH